MCREQQEGGAGGGEGEEEDSQQNNLLDCLVQAQNFALQQAAGNKNFDNNINNFSPQHIMQGEHLSRRIGENIKLVVGKMPLSLSASIRPNFLSSLSNNLKEDVNSKWVYLNIMLHLMLDRQQKWPNLLQIYVKSDVIFHFVCLFQVLEAVR